MPVNMNIGYTFADSQRSLHTAKEDNFCLLLLVVMLCPDCRFIRGVGFALRMLVDMWSGSNFCGYAFDLLIYTGIYNTRSVNALSVRSAGRYNR